MTELATITIVPLIGLAVDLEKPDEVADALMAVGDAKRMLDEARGILEATLVAQARTVGKKTLHLGKHEVTVRGGPEVEWDVSELEKLLDAGLPETRYGELVQTRIDYKVNAAVAKQIEASGKDRKS